MDFKQLRESAGLTLAQVSKLSGYGIATINGLERSGRGSDRLKQMLGEIYSRAANKQNVSAQLVVAELLADRFGESFEDSQRLFNEFIILISETQAAAVVLVDHLDQLQTKTRFLLGRKMPVEKAVVYSEAQRAGRQGSSSAKTKPSE